MRACRTNHAASTRTPLVRMWPAPVVVAVFGKPGTQPPTTGQPGTGPASNRQIQKIVPVNPFVKVLVDGNVAGSPVSRSCSPPV
jgi:hypothetical protein